MASNCFGCGTDNPIGMHLTYETQPDGASTTKFLVDWKFSGEEGVVHGGVQATILDEVMGHAVQQVCINYFNRRVTVVTAEFSLRYLNTCRIDTEYFVSAKVDEVRWPSAIVRGTIFASSGEKITEATARWRVIGEDEPFEVMITRSSTEWQ